MKNPAGATWIKRGLIGVVMTVAALSAQACPVFALTGTVCVTAANYCPAGDENGYLPADGRALKVSQYPMLHALISNQFGGDTSNFNLPDLRGRVPVGLLAASDKEIGVKQGDYRGRENLVLQTEHLAEHAHAVSVSPAGNISVSIPVSASADAQVEPTTTFSYLSQSNATNPAALWTDKTDPVASIKGVVGTMDAIPGKLALEPAGKGASVPIVPPQLGMTYCIATQGSFPAFD